MDININVSYTNSQLLEDTFFRARGLSDAYTTYLQQNFDINCRIFCYTVEISNVNHEFKLHITIEEEDYAYLLLKGLLPRKDMDVLDIYYFVVRMNKVGDEVLTTGSSMGYTIGIR